MRSERRCERYVLDTFFMERTGEVDGLLNSSLMHR